MNISSLISILSQGNKGLPEVDKNYCQTHEIWSDPALLPFYVEPDLHGPENLSPILLISAPAAVGKTTLARYLHNRLLDRGQGALYIPLQHASIGQDFFTGRLAGVFPDLSKRRFLDSVFSGEIVLIFDGYDEVTMRADQIERNKYFIDEIIRELNAFEARGGLPKPSIIFLFRSVFADFGVFDALSGRASQISVQFFDQVRRKQFLSEYLNLKANRDASGTQSKGHLSSAFLDGFETTLSKAKDQAAAFFGHAIVLSAFGDFLHEQDESNAAKLAHELTDNEAIESTAVTLLGRIIKNILEREIEKFPRQEYQISLPSFEPYSKSIQEILLCGVAEDELMLRANQTSYALANAVDSAVAVLEAESQFAHLDITTRDRLRNDYRNELVQRITHHPFVDLGSKNIAEFRNPVYREFYLAKLIAAHPEKNWEVISRANEHSHYLGLFFLNTIQDRNMTGHEGFIFPLISLLATSSSGSDFLFEMNWNAESKQWIGMAQASYLHIDPFYISDSVLTVSIPPQGFLQNVSIVGGTDCLLEIAGPGPEHAYTGPLVLRECIFEADEVSFNAAAIKLETVSINCNTLRLSDIMSSLDGLSSLSMKPIRESIEISMSDYAKGRWGGSLNEAKLEKSVLGEPLFRRKLSKMLLWFRKHKRSEYGIYDMKLQTYVLSGNRDKEAGALVDFLFENDFLSKDGSVIVMNQQLFSNYEIYYEKQNEIKFGPKSSELYGRLVSSRHGQPFLTI